MPFQKVLIIDDDEMDRYVTKRVLSENAFANVVLQASTVEEALSLLASNPQTEFVFLDLNMPGQNGLDFLREYKQHIRDNTAATVVLLLNVANSSDELTTKAKIHPLVKYVIEKPLTAEKLQKIVK